MDVLQINSILRATIDPAQRQHAEQELSQIDKVAGFAPSLLKLVMLNDIEMPIRQAGVIYLKNLLTKYWTDRAMLPEQPQQFIIPEQDRCIIRENIIDAAVFAPDLIRRQLLVCVRNIMKNDFPSRTSQMMEKVASHLQSSDSAKWEGTLQCLYQLVKAYQYRRAENRGPLDETMRILLPIVYHLCIRLLSDGQEEAILLQKQILKIYFAYTEYWLSLEIFTPEIFTLWMDIFRVIADRSIPEKVCEEKGRDQLNKSSWKCRKWALRILLRMFEKYGSPSNVSKEYNCFAEWYLKTFSAGVLKVMLNILGDYKSKVYISDIVLQHTLNYLHEAVGHAYSWKYIKASIFDIFQNVLFPILSYSDADKELWDSDPYEYIRVKFDLLEDLMTPVTAAQSLLQLCCKKRRGVLEKTMAFVTQVLNSPQTDVRQKDGALHMMGQLTDILLVKKKYKDQMNSVLKEYVFPYFTSPHGHMRARACWMMQRCSEMKFKQESDLEEVVQLITNALLNDHDLPVRVQAAIAMKLILKAHERSEKYWKTNVNQITLQILYIIRETKNDGMASVLQEIVHAFPEQLMPIAVDICEHLATTFNQMIEGSDDKAISAIGLMNTIDTLLTAMEDHPEIMARLQPPALSVVGSTFTQGMTDLYEEALFLVDDLTAKKISINMWQVLELLYQVFQRDGFDYFTDMMAALHNYITVDTDTFLSNENYLTAIFNMCKAVLMGDSDEDGGSHAAKLLEVVIIQCRNRIDQCIPSFIELIFHRLNVGVKSTELRTLCLQVAIAALCYNPHIFLATVENLQKSTMNTQPILSHFIKQWIHDTRHFLGVHDRRVCILGLCALLTLPGPRPEAVIECSKKIMPSFITLFKRLKRAREIQAQEGDDDDDEDDEDEDDVAEFVEQEVLSSDESDVDEAKQEYLEKLQGITKDRKNHKRESSDTDTDSELYEETDLESYTTLLEEKDCAIDEYIIFKDLLQNIKVSDPTWYEELTCDLSVRQCKTLEEIMVLAEQRRAVADSKQIEKSGGYTFPNHTVPPTFNFSCVSGDQQRNQVLYKFDVSPKEAML